MSLKVKVLLVSLLPMLVLFLVGIYGGSVFRRSVRDFESVFESYGMIVKTLSQEELVSQFERERVSKVFTTGPGSFKVAEKERPYN